MNKTEQKTKHSFPDVNPEFQNQLIFPGSSNASLFYDELLSSVNVKVSSPFEIYHSHLKTIFI